MNTLLLEVKKMTQKPIHIRSWRFCLIHTTVDIPQNSFYRHIFPNKWSITNKGIVQEIYDIEDRNQEQDKVHSHHTQILANNKTKCLCPPPLRKQRNTSTSIWLPKKLTLWIYGGKHHMCFCEAWIILSNTYFYNSWKVAI